MNPFEVEKTTRENILNAVSALSLEQLNKIPEGFTNNIAWQLGHVLVTQQLLVYKLSGQQPKVTDELIDTYRKGTHAPEHVSAEQIDYIKTALLEMVEITKQDYAKGIFTSFNEYPTSYNITLRSIDDAIEFNNVHEALHLGSIMAMRKLV